MKILIIIVSLLLLGACERYQITVNDREVYAPPRLFNEYQVKDPALDRCIRQAIFDNQIVEAEQLRSINCSHGGIQSLEGITRFTKLQTINLAHNQITDIKSLMFLCELRQVNLAGNDNLACSELTALSNFLSGHLNGAESCKK